MRQPIIAGVRTYRFGPSGVPIFVHLGLSGLHIGIGPPSKADIMGAATVNDAPTKPTTTMNHIIARFMGVFLLGDSVGGGNLTSGILGQVTKVL
jgi:hypothetical protein